MLSDYLNPFDMMLDPFIPLTGYSVAPFSGQQQLQQGGGRRRGLQQRRQGGGALGALTTAEDAGFLDFNSLLSEPLNIQLNEEDNQYNLIVRSPPGIRHKDLHVEVNNNVLTISGEREKHKRKQGTTEYISFSRSMQLPEHVNAEMIEASFDQQGHLLIKCPKQEGQKGPKSIPISGQQKLTEEKPQEQLQSDQQGKMGSDLGSGLGSGLGSEKSEMKDQQMKNQQAAEPRTQGQTTPIR